jgi:hypothetical protein
MNRRPLSRIAAPLTIAVAALAAACSEAGTGPGGIAAVSFDTLPSPALVLGDTLRDAEGNVAPLRAVAYDVDGNVVSDAPIRWIALSRDTSDERALDSLHVDSITGIATAPVSDSALYARRNATVRVLPQVNGLPGPVRQIALTLRPDSLAVPDSALRPFLPLRNDTGGAARSSLPIGARVLHDSASLGATFLPVRAWRVHYSLEYRGAPVPAESRAIWLVDDSFRRSAVDTTDGDGRAARRVRVHPDSLDIGSEGGTDTVTVLITATWLGEPLRGAPARLQLPVQLAPPARR